MSVKIVLYLALCAAVGTGCTRKGDNGKVTIGIGKMLKSHKVGALAYDTVTHIVINVPGVPPYNWDGHHHGTVLAAPEYITLEKVPKGDGKLVQVLLVAEDSVTGVEAFMYGDTTVNVSGDTTAAEVTVSSIGTGTGAEGHVSGRYLNLGGADGPTGDLMLMFAPPNGARPMYIMDMPIINGWFNLFLIDGAAFSYRFKDDMSRTLFAGVNMASPEFAPSQQVLHLIQPAGEAWWGSADHEMRNEEHHIAGFFGPGASASHYACYNATAGTVSNMYLGPGQTNPMTYNPTSTNPSDVRRMGNTGGFASNMTPCTSGSTPYLTRLDIDGKKIGSGKTSTTGFESIFRLPAGAYEVIQTSHALGNVTVSWQLLSPDIIGPSGVDGFTILANVNNFQGELGMGEDGVNCKKMMAEPDLGFVPKMNVTGTGTSASFAMTSAEYAVARIVACPYKLNYAGVPKYYFSGARGPYNNGGGGSMKQVKISGVPTITAGSCASFTVDIKDSAGNPATPDSGAASFTVMGGSGTFYSDACSTSTGSNITLDFGPADTSKTFWYSAASPGYANLGLSPAPSNYSYYNGLEVGVVAASPTPVNHFVVSAPGQMAAGRCYAIYLKREDISNYPTLDYTGTGTAGALTPVNLVWDDGSVPQSDGDFYTSSDCTTGLITSTSFSASSHRADFYFKPTGPASGTIPRRIVAATGAPTSITSPSSTITVGPSTADHYNIFGVPASLSPGICYGVWLEPMNLAGAYVNSTGVVVNLNFSGVEFFGSDNTCNGGGAGLTSGSVSIMSNSSSSSTFYIKHPSSGSPGTFTFSDGTLSGPGNYVP